MNAPMDVAAVLRRNRLLGELDAEQMAEMLTLGRIARFDADQIIFDKGTPATACSPC